MSRVACTVIGFGRPQKSMGWFHAMHLLNGEVPNATLTDVVEPHFMSPQASDPDGSSAFNEFVRTHPGIAFHSRISASAPATSQSLAIISARTADCPALFEQAIEHDFKHIFVESAKLTGLG